MIERSRDFEVELLTPCFCHGADSKASPEVRGASIRGMIREWRRMRGESDSSIEDVWGGDRGGMKASKVGIFIGQSEDPHLEQEWLLPHKDALRSEAIVRARFTLSLSRLVGCTNHAWKHAIRDTETWLLLGCLGQRANRASGSVWPVGEWVPESLDQLGRKLIDLGISWPIYIVRSETNWTNDELHEEASNTLSGYPDIFGEIRPRRQPSPIKFKVIRLGSNYRLLISAQKDQVVQNAKKLLSQKQKPLALECWERLV